MSVVTETEKALAAGAKAGRITDEDAAVVAVLRRLAQAIDDIDDDGLNPAGKLDNVSVPTFLRYCMALGLTPAARAEAQEATKKARSKVEQMRERHLRPA